MGKPLALGLAAAHLGVLFAFAGWRWTRKEVGGGGGGRGRGRRGRAARRGGGRVLGRLVPKIEIEIFTLSPRSDASHVFRVVAVGNFIGVVFARSLHYQVSYLGEKRNREKKKCLFTSSLGARVFSRSPFLLLLPSPSPPRRKKRNLLLVLLLVRPLDPAPPLVDAVPLAVKIALWLAVESVWNSFPPSPLGSRCCGARTFCCWPGSGSEGGRGEEGFFPFDAGSVKSWIPFLLPFLLFCALRERSPVALYCKKNERTKRKRKKFPARSPLFLRFRSGERGKIWRPLRLLTVAALSSPGALPWPRSLSLLERRRGRGRRRSK